VSDGVKRCGDAGGVTRDGKSCRAWLNLSRETGRCLNHDESRREQKLLASRAGGRATAEIERILKQRRETVSPKDLPRIEPDSLRNVCTWLRWCVRSTAIGEIDPKSAREVTAALKQLHAAYAELDLRSRLRAAESRVAKLRKFLAAEGYDEADVPTA
jgi:hypothetical protein